MYINKFYIAENVYSFTKWFNYKEKQVQNTTAEQKLNSLIFHKK